MFFQSFLMVIAEEHLAITIRATRACPAAALLIDRIRPYNTQNILIFKKFYLFIFGCTGSLLLRIVVVKVAQSCSILCDPMDYTVHGILQPRILEWVAFPFSRGSSQPRHWTQVCCIAGGFFLKSLLQHHSSKASILQCSVFFMVQFSHDHWKNHSFDYLRLYWQSDVSAF